jgi:hypothetical protein
VGAPVRRADGRGSGTLERSVSNGEATGKGEREGADSRNWNDKQVCEPVYHEHPLLSVFPTGCWPGARAAERGRAPPFTMRKEGLGGCGQRRGIRS